MTKEIVKEIWELIGKAEYYCYYAEKFSDFIDDLQAILKKYECD